MKLIGLLNSVCNWINRFVGWIVTALFGIMFVACVWQVFTRHVLNSSAIWTDETARYAFIWATMLSATIMTWSKGHAVLSIVVDHLPHKVSAVVLIFSELIVTSVGYVLVHYASHIIKIASIQNSPALHLRMDFIYVAVPICGALFVLYSLVHIIEIVYLEFIKTGGEE